MCFLGPKPVQFTLTGPHPQTPWGAPGLVFYECFRGSRPGTGLVGLGAPKHVFVGSSWPPLGSFWAPLGLLLASSWALLASFWLPLGSPQTLRDSFFTSVFVGLALGPVLSASALKKTFSLAILGSSWPPLGSSWAPLGLLLAPLGLLLGSSWPPLGSSWASLRRSGTRFLRTFLWVSPWDLYFRLRGSKKPPLGLLLALLGLLLACSRLLLGSSWAPLGSSWLLMGSFWLPLGCFFWPRGFFQR